MRVAAIQLNSSSEVRNNLAKVKDLLQKVADLGAELVLLPENFAFFGDEQAKLALAEQLAGEVEAMLRESAVSHNMIVVAGGYPVPAAEEPQKVFNRMTAFGPSKEILFRYDKAHLFDVEAGGICYRESAATAAGRELPGVFTAGGFQITGAICYDLRFPEIFRRTGGDVLLLPAAFTRATGEAHWEILLRARAIENQCYVVAAAQWGEHPGGRHTFGNSMIIDPWGRIVVQLSEGEGHILSDIKKEEILRIREQLPALRHRRFQS